MAVSEGCIVGLKDEFTGTLVFAFGTVLAFEEVLPRVYTIPRVIIYGFNSKTQQQLFLSTLRPPYWCPSKGYQKKVKINSDNVCLF